MDTESQAQEHDFAAGSPWVDMASYPHSQHHSAMNDYHGFGYGPSPIVPIEPSYSISIPQPYTSQQLLPLTTTPQWPSLLTTQSYPSAPLPPMPVSSMPGLHPIQTSSLPTTSTPRRTLTDDDRRRMCIYHGENPHVRQTEIGGKTFTTFLFMFRFANVLKKNKKLCLELNEGNKKNPKSMWILLSKL